MALDLSTLDTVSVADAGGILEVRHPGTGALLRQADGSPVTITLAGEDSDRYRSAQRANTDRRLKAQQAGRPVKLSSDALYDERLEILVAVTISWSGLAFGGETELAFTPDNARDLYRRLPWLREQAEEFVLDRANFLRASPKA